MPFNSSTVVMQENVEEKNDSIRIIKQPSLGENCRLAGEDIAKTEKIFDTGKKISSKNEPSYRHGGLEKGSLFDYKNGRYEKIRIFLAKRDVQPCAHRLWGQ